MQSFSLNIAGTLVDLSRPMVMGIVNLTPDSFYAESRVTTEKAIVERVGEMLNDGASIIDVGACSTRPGSRQPSSDEEIVRLRQGLRTIRQEYPNALLSVDTYRADVARMCVEEYGVGLVNDISGGQMDEAMFSTVARLRVPYILMHMQGTPETMSREVSYTSLVPDIVTYFAQKLQTLYELGVADVILDPGFGFGKTVEQNYELMAHLDVFHELGHPILVGISRKSMIYRLLGCKPEDALNGTSVLHTYALQKGAHVLRVHDVRAAVEVVTVFDKLKNPYRHDNV